jgi:hypothetical protein
MTARKTATLYNTADGPRGIHNADGGLEVAPAGGSVTAEFTAGELADLHPDFTTTKPKGSPDSASPAGSGAGDQTADDQARAVEELASDLVKGKTLEELQTDAKALDLSVAKDAKPEELALAIAQKKLGSNE